MNIKTRKKIKGKFPHKLKSDVTYPVPDKIETTLNDAILKFVSKLRSWLTTKYKNITKIEIRIKNKKPLICESNKKIFFSPITNFKYVINGKLPSTMKIIDITSIKGLLKNPIDSLCVEKPPVAIVVIEWATASKTFIPAR